MKQRLIKISEIAEIKGGKRLPKGQELSSDRTDHLYIRAQDIREGAIRPIEPRYLTPQQHQKLKRYTVSAGDVCVVIVGANVGDVGIVPDELDGANLTENAIKLTNLRQGYLSKYINYCLAAESTQAQMRKVAGGAAQPKLGIYKVLDIEIPVASPESQRCVVDILSSYDDLIENNTRRIKILEQMAQMLYREWFVNFRFPGHRKSKFKIEKGRRIPHGWQFKNLFDLSEVTYGFPFKSKLFTEERIGIPVARIRDILSSTTDTFTTESTDEKYLLRNGDLLVGMDGDFHMGKWSGGRAYQNQRVVRFRPKNNLSPYYLFLAIQEPIHHFDSTIVGTTVAHLSDRDLRSVELLIPDDELLKATALILNPCFDLEINLALKNSNLRTTRDLLLPRLVSGEISVEEIDTKAAAQTV